MTLCTCPDRDQLNCECSVCDSDCLEVVGSGNGVSLAVNPRLSEEDDNILSCSATGLLVQLPTTLLTPPSSQAYNSIAISLTNDVGTVVSLDSERYDNDTMHSTVTNNSRITFNTAGIYIVVFNCAFAGNTTGDRQALIRANGSDFLGGSEKIALSSASYEMGMSVAVQEFFEVGDYVEAVVKQDSGGSLNLLATRYSPILSAHFRRGTPS